MRFHYILGICYRELDQWNKAVDQFKLAIAFPDEQKSMRVLSKMELGKCYVQLKKYQASIDVFDKIAKENYQILDPDYPRYPNYKDDIIADDALYFEGKSYLKLGQKNKALECFAKISRYFLNSPLIKNISLDF